MAHTQDAKRRIFVIVLDGVGAGELPDAADYGDVGANTLAHTAEAVGGLNLPTMAGLGLGNITPIHGRSGAGKTPRRVGQNARSVARQRYDYRVIGRLRESFCRARFPPIQTVSRRKLSARLKQAIGTKTLGNYAASGTEIIAKHWARNTSERASRLFTRRRTACFKSLCTKALSPSSASTKSANSPAIKFSSGNIR